MGHNLVEVNDLYSSFEIVVAVSFTRRGSYIDDMKGL